MQSLVIDHPVRSFAVTIFGMALMMAGRADCAVPIKLFFTALRSADSLSCYEIFELSFKYNGFYDSNFFDVALDVAYMSPSGTERRIKCLIMAVIGGRLAFVLMRRVPGPTPTP